MRVLSAESSNYVKGKIADEHFGLHFWRRQPEISLHSDSMFSRVSSDAGQQKVGRLKRTGRSCARAVRFAPLMHTIQALGKLMVCPSKHERPPRTRLIDYCRYRICSCYVVS